MCPVGRCQVGFPEIGRPREDGATISVDESALNLITAIKVEDSAEIKVSKAVKSKTFIHK